MQPGVLQHAKEMLSDAIRVFSSRAESGESMKLFGKNAAGSGASEFSGSGRVSLTASMRPSDLGADDGEPSGHRHASVGLHESWDAADRSNSRVLHLPKNSHEGIFRGDSDSIDRNVYTNVNELDEDELESIITDDRTLSRTKSGMSSVKSKKNAYDFEEKP